MSWLPEETVGATQGRLHAQMEYSLTASVWVIFSVDRKGKVNEPPARTHCTWGCSVALAQWVKFNQFIW